MSWGLCRSSVVVFARRPADVFYKWRGVVWGANNILTYRLSLGTSSRRHIARVSQRDLFLLISRLVLFPSTSRQLRRTDGRASVHSLSFSVDRREEGRKWAVDLPKDPFSFTKAWGPELHTCHVRIHHHPSSQQRVVGCICTQTNIPT